MTQSQTRRMRVVSGIQPTGGLHLGNLLGAILRWVRMQDEAQCLYFLADLHALTVEVPPQELRSNLRNMAAALIASGIEPERSIIFAQSAVPAHAELCWILNGTARMGWLNRMTQWKDKAGKNKEGASVALFDYPVLQAADILLYKPHFVPVGKDQLPHLELTREVARRFNDLYKQPVFPEPKEHLTKFPKVPGTDGRKMSKSYGNTINLSDSEPVVRQKLKTMVTDPARVRRMDPGNPDLCPVFDFHKMFSPLPIIEQINRECRTAEIGCIDCKKLVADRVVDTLAPILEARAALVSNPSQIEEIVEEGSRKAGAVAKATLHEATGAMMI